VDRRRAQIVGVGETRYTRWGKIGDGSEHALACEAIARAVADAGLSLDDVDGLASFADDRNEAVFLAAELGLPALRFANMVWMPGEAGLRGRLERRDGGRDRTGRGGRRLPLAVSGAVLPLRHRGHGCPVVTTAERARDLAKRPVEILASEQGAPRGYAFGPFTNVNLADELYATGGCEEMAGRLWRKAGLPARRCRAEERSTPTP